MFVIFSQSLSKWLSLFIFCFLLLCAIPIQCVFVAIFFAISCEVLHVMFVWDVSVESLRSVCTIRSWTGQHMAKFVATVAFSTYYLYIPFSHDHRRTAPLFIIKLLFNAFAVPSDSKSMLRIIMSYSMNLISFMQHVVQKMHSICRCRLPDVGQENVSNRVSTFGSLECSMVAIMRCRVLASTYKLWK